jgi:ABC-type proline/glycine betaine transport system ATPase subunit
MADLICLLDQGKIQQLATPKELLFEPNNTFVKSFLADKRLQLELHALTLNDLSDFLPDVQTPPPSPIDIHANTSVIEVIRIFTQHNFDQAMAKTQFEGFAKFYDFGTLMNSFQHRIAQLKNASA